MSSFVSDIVDKDEVALDCDYNGFHYETGNTSDDHATENQQVSFDSEDADWDGQGVVFADGDTILLHCWTDTQCCVVKITSDGSDSYTQPMQLLECQAPSATLFINDGWKDKELSANQSSSDEYQWDYEGTTHYHRAEWYGATLCTNVGIDTIEYDFEDGYDTITTHTFTDIGDYDIKLKVTNLCGLVTEVTKTIRIRYIQPPVDLTNDPVKPVINEDTVVDIENTDPDSRITSQTWYIDDVETDTLTHQFSDLGTYYFKVTTEWNDGFEDLTFDTILPIEIENQPPTTDMLTTLTDESDGSQTWLIESNAVDPEDHLDYITLSVYVDKNYIIGDNTEESWIHLDTKQTTDLDNSIKFNTSGKFKLLLQAFDEQGLSSEIEEKIIEIESGDCSSEQCAYFDWE